MKSKYNVGIEREYTVVSGCDDDFSYVLCTDLLLQEFHKHCSPDARELLNLGWRLEPEYSRVLIEVVSPPLFLDQQEEMSAGFNVLEKSLQATLNEISRDNSRLTLQLSRNHGSKSNRFQKLDGTHTFKWEEILLDPEKQNFILNRAEETVDLAADNIGTSHARALVYAGFTSTHITISRSDWESSQKRIDQEQWIEMFWRLSRTLLENYRHDGDHQFIGADGNRRLSLPCRESFIQWMDYAGNEIVKHSAECDVCSFKDREKFRMLFGFGPYTDGDFDSVKNYAISPRLREGLIMYEVRSLDGSISNGSCFEIIDEIYKTWAQYD